MINNQITYRQDIQALRGIAVLMVVFYHARLLPLSGGYLGVDVFFVISGFLITRQIARQLSDGNFSFRQFYLRRAWRLLPAAYAVFIVCLLIAPWTLSTAEQIDFTEQLIGAITFSANIVLWTQTGYFEQAAEIKPLLHTWSLSIEEQYYLILPALLVMVKPRIWLVLASLITLSSFILMSLLIEPSPSAVFYLTPTRIWELGIGSVIALFLVRYNPKLPSGLGYFAIFLLVLISHTQIQESIPPVVSLLTATLTSAIIIIGRPVFLNQGASANVLAHIGTRSYSLYLVHWPIFAFLNSLHISGGPTWYIRLVAVIAAFFLAWVLYALIEKRFRITDAQNTKTFWPLIAISLALLLFASASLISNGQRIGQKAPLTTLDLSDKCGNSQFYNQPECVSSIGNSKVLLWGDSFAMHLIPGLKSTDSPGLEVASRTTCAPFISLSQYNPPNHPLARAESCLKFNQGVLNYALNNPNIEVVAFASQWSYLLHDRVYATTHNNEANMDSVSASIVTSIEVSNRLINLVEVLQASNKKVIVLDSTPTTGMDVAKCHQRLAGNQLTIGGTDNCVLPMTLYRQNNQRTIELMNRLKQAGIAVYSFADKLCNAEHCRTKLNGYVLYSDSGHFSLKGSQEYAVQYHLYQNLRELAQ